MKATHTPGPWVEGKNSEIFSKYACVCSLWGISPEIDANARLIAAAPDLLVALEEFVSWAVRTNVISEPEDEKILAEAKSAITKAHGE